MQFPFTIEFAVRGYEMDIFHHVNNAVYLQWFEHARWSMVSETTFGQLFMENNMKPVVRFTDIDYRAETVYGDTVRISIWPRKVGNTSVTLGQCIHVVKAQDKKRIGKLTTVSSVVLTCVKDGEGKVAVPQALRDLFPKEDPGVEPNF